MKNNIDEINGWLYHRIRMCIWKQWKKPKTKVRNLIKMGVRGGNGGTARALVYHAYSRSQYGYDKRKTDKQWLL